MSWSGRGWRTLCFRINSEPRGAENREGSSTLAESSRLTWCSILIGWRHGWQNTWFWLAAESRVCSILIGCRDESCRFNVIKYGAESRKPTQCLKIGNARIKIGDARNSIDYSSSQWVKIWNDPFSAVCDNFRHCETSSKSFSELIFFAGPPAWINNTARTSHDACCRWLTLLYNCYACRYCFDLLICKKIA